MRFTQKPKKYRSLDEWRKRFALFPVRVGYDELGNTLWAWMESYEVRGSRDECYYLERRTEWVHTPYRQDWQPGFPES